MGQLSGGLRQAQAALRSNLRGSWEPGEFASWIIFAAKLTLFSMCVIRGTDYITGDSHETARRLSAVESAAPLWVWGGVFLFSGILGFLSIISHRHIGIFYGHLLSWVAYWALSVGIFLDVVERSNEDGWVTIMEFFVVLGIGAILVVLVDKIFNDLYSTIAMVCFALVASVGVLTIEFDGLRNGSILFGVGCLHSLMAIGTISRARQIKIASRRLLDNAE